jgi:hypothetical protein
MGSAPAQTPAQLPFSSNTQKSEFHYTEVKDSNPIAIINYLTRHRSNGSEPQIALYHRRLPSTMISSNSEPGTLVPDLNNRILAVPRFDQVVVQSSNQIADHCQ